MAIQKKDEELKAYREKELHWQETEAALQANIRTKEIELAKFVGQNQPIRGDDTCVYSDQFSPVDSSNHSAKLEGQNNELVYFQYLL